MYKNIKYCNRFLNKYIKAGTTKTASSRSEEGKTVFEGVTPSVIHFLMRNDIEIAPLSISTWYRVSSATLISQFSLLPLDNEANLDMLYLFPCFRTMRLATYGEY